MNKMVVYIVLGIAVLLTAGTHKTLPVGTCIAQKSTCNLYDKELDPWEQRCFSGSILKIDAVGKRSYKTSCLEKVAFCIEFVHFKDVKSDYFQIDCPKLEQPKDVE
jgi:hypothetical protein